MGGVFRLSNCTVYGYNEDPRREKEEKKEERSMHAYDLYFQTVEVVVDMVA